MNSVSRNRVVNAWLSLEQGKRPDEEFRINSNVEECEKVARLLAHKPDAASIFWKHEFDWYHHEITEREFRTLHTVWEGNNIFEVARAIKHGRSSLSRDKIEKIKSIAAKNSVVDLGPLFIYRRKGLRTGPFLADGNHRAVGIALQSLNQENYTTQSAYVGYPAKAYSKCARGNFHRVLNRL